MDRPSSSRRYSAPDLFHLNFLLNHQGIDPSIFRVSQVLLMSTLRHPSFKSSSQSSIGRLEGRLAAGRMTHIMLRYRLYLLWSHSLSLSIRRGPICSFSGRLSHGPSIIRWLGGNVFFFFREFPAAAFPSGGYLQKNHRVYRRRFFEMEETNQQLAHHRRIASRKRADPRLLARSPRHPVWCDPKD